VSYRRLSPKLGATVRLADGLNLFGSYRAAFRAPSESQLFRQGSAESTVDLEPVKADNHEVGLRLDVGARVSAEAAVYRLDIEDDILSFFDPATGLRRASNAGETRHEGIELSLAAAPIDGVRLHGSWAHARHTYRDWRPSPTVQYSGNEMELAPRNMGRLGLTLSPGFLDGGSLGAEYLHFGRYWMDPANTAEYPGYDLLHFAATLPVLSGLELVTRLQNATGEHYAETSSFNAFQGRRFRPGQPRTFFLGAQYRFGSGSGAAR
jgi:outer membrane receptor protein involved in Fe transport